MRAQAAVYQPCLYYDELPRNLKGEAMPEGTFILVHNERDDETDWGLIRFCETYPCPAERKARIGESYVTEPVQTQKDIDAAQAVQRVARHFSRAIDSRGSGGGDAAHADEADERSTQDRRGHDTERTGSDGEHAEGSEVRDTGSGEAEDNLASNNGTTKVTQPGGCPHCGYRHPPDGMCLK